MSRSQRSYHNRRYLFRCSLEFLAQRARHARFPLTCLALCVKTFNERPNNASFAGYNAVNTGCGALEVVKCQLLSISQIETIHKKNNHEFPDKIIFGGEGLGGEERVVFTIKAFTGSILKYCFVFFALSNLTINVNFLAERKRSYLIFS